jgi:putative transposase
MGTSAFEQGTQVFFKGQSYVLLRKVTDDTWQLEETRSKRIHEYTDRQLRISYVDGELVFANRRDTALTGVRTENTGKSYQALTPAQWELVKLRRVYVHAILDLPNTREVIASVIQDIWQRIRQPESSPGCISVYRWKQRYLKAGKDITSLVPQNARRGNRSFRIPHEVVQFVEQAIEDIYMTLERKTIQDTLDQAITRVSRENKLRPNALQLPTPTYRLVKRLIEAIPAFDRYAARYGRTAAVKRFRSVQAHRTTAAPLERAEMDHTLLDLMVIDDNFGMPLGRPWITACIDDYTRCVLGIYVSFEPPSHFTVARCLKHAFLPKVELRQDYPAIKNPWEAHGVMRELVVDNGTEFHSASLENACYSLGIEIHYSARKTPWFKGKIERFLGTLNRAVAHGNPGTTFQNIFEKDEYDPSKHAVVRYNTLKEIIRIWIADVYHQKVHRALGAPPAAMWGSSITPEEILVPDDPARLDAILGRSEERRLTHKGIELYGLFYNSPELTELRRQLGDKLDVEVRVDAADLGHIIVFSPNKRQMFKVPALNFNYADGLSEWQHRICKRYAARELEQYSPASWLEAKDRIAKLIDEEFSHKKQKTRAKIARYQEHARPGTSDAPVPLRSNEPLQPPDVAVTPKALPSITPDGVSSEPTPVSTPATPRKKFKPIYRERHPQFIDAEQRENVTHG